MLNLNEEITFYKDADFVEYLLGVGSHESEHSEPSQIQVTFVCNGITKVFEGVNYSDFSERAMLSDCIISEVNDWPEAMLSFRCDFDYNMLPGEEESFSIDYEDVVNLFKEFSKQFYTRGFIVTHFSQKDSVDGDEVDLTKHIHIVYTENSQKTFSEFLQTKLL